MAGAEAITLGLHELEMPGMDLGRVPQGGRNFEYLGEDPYLAGTIAVNIIKGVQSKGVIAMAKHYVLNDQEANRNQVSVIIDDRPLHELYLLPFEMSVKDGNVASLMCSYNRIGGVYACEEPYLLNKVLREQWGFKGYVQSDFGPPTPLRQRSMPAWTWKCKAAGISRPRRLEKRCKMEA